MQDLNCEDPNIQYKEVELLQDLKQSQHKQLSLELLLRQCCNGQTGDSGISKKGDTLGSYAEKKETQMKVMGTKGGRYIQEFFEENIIQFKNHHISPILICIISYLIFKYFNNYYIIITEAQVTIMS